MKSIWHYRQFIVATVIREFQARYQSSLFGWIWTIINPLAMIFIYTVVFSQIMRAKLPEVTSEYGYGIYIFSGILVWGIFSEIITRGLTLYIDNANLLKKINFPRLSLPITMMMGACVNFMIMLSLFIVILVLVGETPDTNLLYLFPLMGILLSLAMGIGMCLAILNVYFRDMAQLTPIILQFWFWLTPIVYPISILPISIQELVLVLNPLAAVVSAMHSILVFHRPVEMESLLVPLAFAFVACLIALKLHKSHGKYLVDEL